MKRWRHRSSVLTELAYRLGLSTGVPIASLLLRSPALRQGHRGRLGAVARLEAWARTHRDPSRPLAWFHAASVGEGLQARAVLTALRQLRPDLQVVATRFSASAERLAGSMPADITEYIPYDRRGDVARSLAALRPDLLVFAKLDVWPELATRAALRGTRVALVAGSVDPGSARLGWLATALARRGYAALDLAAAISTEDAERLVQLGARRERVVVTSDPRVDAVLETVADVKRERRGNKEQFDQQLLVAGSTWAEDEAVLLDALTLVRRSFPDARMLVVPHEPTADHVATLATRARNRGLTVATWGGDTRGTAAVTIVERMGVLTALYATGAVAYVG
jgi:3-deoxy-D-manno-octulosonic-acid transferase